MGSNLETLELRTVAQSNLPQAKPEETPDYKQLPHNFEAEQGVLGAILINNEAYERVAEFLRGEHFADPVHGRIYNAARTLIERGQMANPVTLKNYFDQEKALTDIGGAKYLARLATSVLTAANIADYAREVHELYLRRQLIQLGEEVANDAYKYDLESTSMGQIESAERKLYDLATTGDYERGFKSFDNVLIAAVEMAESAYKRDGQLTGLASGLTDLDQLLGGLNPSDLIVLAGRPSMGKTALATNIAFHIAQSFKPNDEGKTAKDGGRVGFFSLEMSAEQLATRIIAEQASIPSEKIRRGNMNQQDITNLIQTSRRLSQVPLYIDDTPGLTVSALRTRARRLQRQHGLDMIVVDYLQLIQGSGRSGNDNRVQEISEITRGLKTLAKELNVPVIALSQLSRAVEQREDKRPQLADLRESGSIEQDADVVMFVFRQEYYEERNEPAKRSDEPEDRFMERYARWQETYQGVANQAEVIIAKQRHGPIGKVILHFEGATTKFSNFAKPGSVPEAY